MSLKSAKSKLGKFIGEYGRVGIVVHCSVSLASMTGLYVAIKNNVDVQSALEKIGVSSATEPQQIESEKVVLKDDVLVTDGVGVKKPVEGRNRTAEIVATSGGAMAAASLLNKALFPIRMPITIVLTPPIVRILARRSIVKKKK